MKFSIKFEWYPAGIGQRKYMAYGREAESQEKALESIYLLSDFNPEYRVISVEEVDAQDGANQDGAVRAEAGADEHAESPSPSSLFRRA